jgi:hypothetical protein
MPLGAATDPAARTGASAVPAGTPISAPGVVAMFAGIEAIGSAAGH